MSGELPVAGCPAAPGPAGEVLVGLVERLGHVFEAPELLAQALAHRSWCAEAGGHGSNERLEFLGDAVLGQVVTDHIFRAYPELPEGELAMVRASVVSSEALAEVAIELDLGVALLLGKGEDSSGGRAKPSILADAAEAVIGAVYLDGGWEPAAALVMRLLGERIKDAALGPGGRDYKTRLQEVVARRADQLPRYVVRDVGPDHAKHFFASVSVDGLRIGEGEGRSKKQAEQAAAQVAWLALTAAEPAVAALDGQAPTAAEPAVAALAVAAPDAQAVAAPDAPVVASERHLPVPDAAGAAAGA